MLRRCLLAVTALGTAVGAQAQDVAPVPVKTPSGAAALPIPIVDSNVAPFYAARPETLIWLNSVDSRAATAKLIEILKRSPIDGLVEGPALAATVEAALAGGTAADDQRISAAWVRYVQALARPVPGVEFGDPALQLRPRGASAILADAAAAPSLAAHLDAAAAVNPLYAALRADAVAQGRQDDPRVLASLDRLRIVKTKGRVLLVDVANAELMLLEDGRTVDTMQVIVGKPTFPTPLLAGTMHYVTFNPYWHIPQDVTRRKVAPIVLKRGTGYLKLAKYEAVSEFGERAQLVDPDSIDWKAVAAGEIEANIRQKAGGNNMMGQMKFGFVNDHGIFLHDTPEKQLFKKAKRTLSLGCVRVERPEALARWLLGRDPVPPGTDAEQNVQMPEGVPIYISYLTARPAGEAIAFATDVYKLDTPAAATAASAN